ncbi:MAG: hypothetical protein ABSB56_02020 [Nitrososphaerales archaeon]
MIPDLLPLRLLLAFGSGWLVVATVTSVADAHGAGRAGFAGGLPSTAVVSLLLIGATQSQDAAIQATTLLPLAFSVTFAFLLFYAFPKRMRFGRRMLVALALWFLASMLVAVLAPDSFTFSLAGSVAASLIIFFVHRRIRVEDVPRVPSRFSVGQMIWRGALGGCVVAGVVTISTLSGPLVAGAFAGVPAIWSSSLYATSRAHGVEFSRSLTKSFMRTGILTIIPYCVAARYLFSAVGIWWGTLFAYLLISPAAWLAWELTRCGSD